MFYKRNTMSLLSHMVLPCDIVRLFTTTDSKHRPSSSGNPGRPDRKTEDAIQAAKVLITKQCLLLIRAHDRAAQPGSTAPALPVGCQREYV
jgi:hypothetical protein